jgi:hypothetical protein
VGFIESIPSDAFFSYLAFGAFSFYQKLHLKNFKGASKAFHSILSVSSVLCTCVGLFYLYTLWDAFGWKTPALFFVASILSMIPLFFVERIVPPVVMSVAGLVGWPLCAWLMFTAAPPAPKMAMAEGAQALSHQPIYQAAKKEFWEDLPIVLEMDERGRFIDGPEPAGNQPLTYQGRECTSDCSGHRAGYRWAEKKDISDEDDCRGNSQSFREGCISFVDEQNNGSSDHDHNDAEEDGDD